MIVSKVAEYKTISSTDLEQFDQRVNALLQAGWEIHTNLATGYGQRWSIGLIKRGAYNIGNGKNTTGQAPHDDKPGSTGSRAVSPASSTAECRPAETARAALHNRRGTNHQGSAR